jgi:membrane fusion protein (multidrug efflux system)
VIAVERSLSRLSRPVRLAAAAAGAGIVALLVSLATPGEIHWSDANANVAAPPPRLGYDLRALSGDDRLASAEGMRAPATFVSAHGVVRSGDEAVIASRMTALITALPLEAGQGFARGQLLAAFDCSQLKAQLNAAQAAASAYRKTYETNVELDQYKAIGINEVAVSKANLGKAAAEAQALAAGTTQCEIRAPFAGTVVERIAHPHDIAASGQPLMRIQGNGDLEVELIVPSSWLTWLAPGAPFTFALDETGGSVEGRVARLGAAVDPVSRTLRVTGRIVVEGTVLPGMSGTARFTREAADGHAA